MRHSNPIAHGFALPPARRAARCALILVVVLLPILPAMAQQAQPTQGTGAAFVSRLKAEPIDFHVKLTWIDAGDFTGSCLVYRSSTELTTQTVAKALLVGSVATGVGYFIDTPPDRGGYFYAVVLQDSVGTAYPVLVAYRNKTSAAVSVQTTAPEEDLAARIDRISAALTGASDAILVTFRSSNPARDLLLFWGTTPLTAPEDLLRSTTTTPLDPGATRYVVAGLPGVDYWFAVLDAGLYKIGQTPLVIGANVTSKSVQIPLTTGRISLSAPAVARRATPLPSLSLTRGVQSDRQLADDWLPIFPAERDVTPDTEKAIANLRAAAPGAHQGRLGPTVLRADTTPSPSGELARLQEIVQGSFLNGDMAGTAKKLADFLSLPRSPELEAHARFYLGQVYSIVGRTRDALLEFLVAEDFFYQETVPWIDACFEILERADQ